MAQSVLSQNRETSSQDFCLLVYYINSILCKDVIIITQIDNDLVTFIKSRLSLQDQLKSLKIFQFRYISW